MMLSFKEIEGIFEDFDKKEGRFLGEWERFDYVAPTSEHSPITVLGYGERLKLSCVDISARPLDVGFSVSQEEIDSRRFYVRLTACMPEWEKHYNNLSLRINGEQIYNRDKTLFENVCVGWPVTYYPFPAKLLSAGENTVTVSTTNNTGAGLYAARVDLLSLPAIREGMQLSSVRYARVGSLFTVAVFTKDQLSVVSSRGLLIKEIKKSELDAEISLLLCEAVQKDVSLTVACGDKTVDILCPEIVPEDSDTFFVGTDSDDYRQDYTEEADRIPMIFALTGMGNFYQFRPSLYRSVAELPDEATWTKRTKWLYDFGIKLSLADGAHPLSYLARINPDMYVGKHCHETYLYFQSIQRRSEKGRKRFHIDMDKINNANTFGECKRLYLEALDGMYAEQKTDIGVDSVGAPSLLVTYEASKFARLTMEPVSGVNLLLGATRGSATGMWGAHIPICWYYGYYNDICKARKYWNTMFYSYINGADYVYAENGLFKVQSMSREDWDTEFSIINREYTKQMYDYSVTHPRRGELQIPFAAVYGNNEFILWHKDSRIPELEDCEDWDLNVWGKWPERNTYLCWRATDAWLPVAKNQNTVDDKFNLSLHSGTRFGSVDVIPYEKDYSPYKLVAFLGWNTYEEKLSRKLYDYIENGGNALISYCHFNKIDRPDMEFEYASDDGANALLGFESGKIAELSSDVIIDGKAYGGIENVKIVVPEGIDAEPICRDSSGNVIFYKRKIGKGYLYFCTFATYYGYYPAVEVMKAMLGKISEGLADSSCDNGNIAYTERLLPDGKRQFHFINMSSGSDDRQSFTISVNRGGHTEKHTMDIGVTEIKELIV